MTRGQITHVEIPADDPERAKRFYQAVFGVVIEREDGAHYTLARGVDGTRIELEGMSEHRFPGWAERHIGTYKNSEFAVTDIQAFVASVVEHGGRIVTPPVARPWGGFGAEVADPDGNVLPISQP